MEAVMLLPCDHRDRSVSGLGGSGCSSSRDSPFITASWSRYVRLDAVPITSGRFVSDLRRHGRTDFNGTAGLNAEWRRRKGLRNDDRRERSDDPGNCGIGAGFIHVSRHRNRVRRSGGGCTIHLPPEPSGVRRNCPGYSCDDRRNGGRVVHSNVSRCLHRPDRKRAPCRCSSRSGRSLAERP